MLTPEISGEKLRELGVFTPPGVVMTIVLHLKSGGKQNQLYPATASNKTVLKIKKLLDAGELDWMTEELSRLNLLLERTLFKMVEASDEDQVKIIREIKGWEIHKDDGLGSFRLQITEEAEDPLRGWGWSISNLERIGIPLKDALGILQEYDGLLMVRESSVVIGSDYAYLLKFRGFERYLYLNHLVYLMEKYPKARYKYVLTATTLYTRGVVSDDYTSDDSIKTAGEDILRYEVWRGGGYEEAYYKSLKRYKRTPKRNAQLRDQIDSLLKGNGNG